MLSKGDGGGPDVATRYYERALPNLKEASAKLDAVVKRYGEMKDKSKAAIAELRGGISTLTRISTTATTVRCIAK